MQHVARGLVVPGVAPTARVERPRLMVGVAFLSYNVAIGMGFGAYGTMVAAIQREFATSRTLAVSGLSVLALMIGLISPLLGMAMARVRIRSMMIAGALMCAAGYLALTLTRDIYVLLAIFACLIGPGAALAGPVPASTLVANWVDEAGRGRALGFVTMPLFIFFFPTIASLVLKAGGLNAVFVMLAVLMVALVPMLLLVQDKPRAVALLPGTPAAVAVVTLTAGAIMRRPAFAVLALGSSLVVSSGMIMTSHLVSIGLEHGLDLTRASLLLSVFGGSGAAGALLFGWLADRLGVRIAFAAIALLPLVAIFTLMGTPGLAVLLGCAGLMGLCMSAVTGLQGAGAGAWFGAENFARTAGLIFLIQVPFLFGAAPLAGYLYDRTGSYHAALVMVAAILAFTGAMFLVYRPKRVVAIGVAA